MNRIRPAPGGCSIGEVTVTAGTLGCLVFREGLPFILSNNHVLAAVNKAKIGASIIQPGRADGGTVEKDEIAKLYDFVEISFEEPSNCLFSRSLALTFNILAHLLGRKTRLIPVVAAKENRVDAAIAKPIRDEDVVSEILEVGKIVGEAEAFLGMNIKKSGRTTGLTSGKVTMVNAAFTITLGNGEKAIFTDQVGASPMSEGGDSGSIVLTEDNKVVGLLFAGSERVTIFNRWKNVKEELNVEYGKV